MVILYNLDTQSGSSKIHREMTKPICLWSGPRNVSTALMYSFAEIEQIQVVDEPLYGHYLRVSGADHPGREEIIERMNCDGNAVAAQLLVAPPNGRRLFIKHMAHHLVDLELDFLQEVENVFLIRDPREMLPSLTIQLPHATQKDTGLRRQWQLFEQLTSSGHRPVVLDSRELLLAPTVVLEKLCRHLDVPFSAAMLSWKPGPNAADGIWAKHWYHAVHASSGFAPYVAKPEFPTHLQPLLDECRPWYEKLFAHAIRAKTHG